MNRARWWWAVLPILAGCTSGETVSTGQGAEARRAQKPAGAVQGGVQGSAQAGAQPAQAAAAKPAGKAVHWEGTVD